VLFRRGDERGVVQEENEREDERGLFDVNYHTSYTPS
jgi:hypothetical protein